MAGVSARTGAVVCMALVAAGCGGTRERAAAPGAASSNEKQLTHAQSVRLVGWARTFRSCMAERGTTIGHVTPRRTRIDMRLGAAVTAADVVPGLTACAERQGGPPQDTSLQYRRGRIVLYLPKRCLLDPKVAQA
jgi:hypothetical protein